MIDQRHRWEERLSQRFDLAAVGYLSLGRSYNFWLYKAKTRALERAIKHCQVPIRNSKVLDIGCGTGYWIHDYASRGAGELVGIDITRASISRLQKKYPQYSFRQADVSKADLHLGCNFDIINAFEVFWYLDDKQFERAFTNIVRVMASGAYLFITDFLGSIDSDPSSNSVAGEYPRNLTRYQAECDQHGLQILSVFPLYYVMNAPTDLNSVPSTVLNGLITTVWRVTRRLTSRFPDLGHPLGALLYHIDGLALKCLPGAPSTKLIVCKYSSD